MSVDVRSSICTVTCVIIPYTLGVSSSSIYIDTRVWYTWFLQKVWFFTFFFFCSVISLTSGNILYFFCTSNKCVEDFHIRDYFFKKKCGFLVVKKNGIVFSQEFSWILEQKLLFCVITSIIIVKLWLFFVFILQKKKVCRFFWVTVLHIEI